MLNNAYIYRIVAHKDALLCINGMYICEIKVSKSLYMQSRNHIVLERRRKTRAFAVEKGSLFRIHIECARGEIKLADIVLCVRLFCEERILLSRKNHLSNAIILLLLTARSLWKAAGFLSCAVLYKLHSTYLYVEIYPDVYMNNYSIYKALYSIYADREIRFAWSQLPVPRTWLDVRRWFCGTTELARPENRPTDPDRLPALASSTIYRKWPSATFWSIWNN